MLKFCSSSKGASGILWFAAWQLIVHENPDEHPTISQAEKDLITNCSVFREVSYNNKSNILIMKTMLTLKRGDGDSECDDSDDSGD